MVKKSGEKYQAIIEAAIKVIAKYGYHSSQVSRIAREAGVADGTIYLYFESKEDLLISLFRNKMGLFTNEAPNELKGLKDPFEILARLISKHFSKLQANRNLASVLQIQLRQSELSIRQSISEIVQEYYQLIEKFVRYGIEEGSFRQDIDPVIAREIIFGCLDQVSTCWVLSNSKYDLTERASPVYHLLAQGLALSSKARSFSEDWFLQNSLEPLIRRHNDSSIKGISLLHY